MRILWLSHLVPYPPKGGVMQRSFYLLREAARRHQVDFVGLVQPAHQPDEEALAVARDALDEFCQSISTFWILTDRRWWGRPALHFRSIFNSRPYDANWLENERLRRHLASRDATYDLIHVDTIGLVSYVRELSGIPFVLNHHNIESQMMEDRAGQEGNPLKRLYMGREAKKLKEWERRWTPLAAVNTVVSSLDADRLAEKVDGSSISVVENGVDVDYFKPRTPPEAHDGHLIFVGGMSWYPNRDAMLWFVREIWPRIHADDPERRAMLIGRDPPDELRAAAEDGRLNVPGFVDDIRPAVDRALAYVCPIRKGGGTRLKVLDALAMAKPLVATSFAVEGLELVSGKHYLEAESPSEFRDQIRRLVVDSSLRRRLGMAGRTLVEERYSWKVVGGHLEAVFRNASQADSHNRDPNVSAHHQSDNG